MLNIQNMSQAQQPLELKNYEAENFMKYLLSLHTENEKRSGLSAYYKCHLALFHLFRIYSRV